MGRTSDARERLIQACIDVVWPASYGAVGVDLICETAGVKKGSFYHFFPSKVDLVVAAIDAHWEGCRAGLDRIFSPTVPPLDRLRRYFAHVLARQIEVRNNYGRVLGCFYHCLGTECIQGLPAVAAQVQRVLSQYRSYLESAIRDAQASGDLDSTDPAADANMLFACIEGALAQARIHDDPEILRRLPEAGFALLGRPSSPAPRPAKPRKISKTARP